MKPTSRMNARLSRSPDHERREWLMDTLSRIEESLVALETLQEALPDYSDPEQPQLGELVAWKPTLSLSLLEADLLELKKEYENQLVIIESEFSEAHWADLRTTP